MKDTQQENNQISIYEEGKVSAKALALNIVRLKKAFPKLPAGWYDILEEMISADHFSDDRLNDAVNNLIRTCPYPEPTIANLIGYNRNIQLYSYNELLEKYKDHYYAGSKSDPINENYKQIKYNNEIKWVKKEFGNKFKEK